MLFSIVIPTHNRYPALQRCLEMLRPEIQDFPASDYEVIVSDDTPLDRAKPIPNPGFPSFQAIDGPRRGPASNRNCGAKLVRGEWIIFVDDDCIPQAGYLQGYRNAVQAHPECRLFEGRTVPDRPKARMDEESPITDNGGFLWSCNMSIRRDFFERVGGFCEDFIHVAMEDVDFRMRVTATGEKFLHVPEARVVHPWRLLSIKPEITYVHIASVRMLYARHPEERPTFIRYLRIITREFLNGFNDGLRFRFRGLGRWLVNRFYFTAADIVLAWDSLFARR
jgi:GT2 family glycosyltransferase